MVPRETVSFVFPRVLMFPETSSRETSELGPCIKCFVIYLDFHIAKPNKQGQRRGNNYAIVSRSGYIWIWSEARDQESSNHSAHLTAWMSSYITKVYVNSADSFAFFSWYWHWFNSLSSLHFADLLAIFCHSDIDVSLPVSPLYILLLPASFF